jgi:hypothetical protein
MTTVAAISMPFWRRAEVDAAPTHPQWRPRESHAYVPMHTYSELSKAS